MNDWIRTSWLSLVSSYVPLENYQQKEEEGRVS
jgi:hypothetical protein